MCHVTSRLTRHLDSSPAAAGQARSLLRSWACRTHGMACLDDAELALSEVVTNAVIHAGPPIDLAFDCRGDTLTIDVHDGAPGAPVSGPHAPDGDLAERGRGLQILDLLAPGWHVDTDASGGKTVSFTLPC